MKRVSRWWLVVVCVLAMFSRSSWAAPTMDAVEFPIDLGSVGLAMLVAAGGVFVVVFAAVAGVKLVKKTFHYILRELGGE